MKIIKALLYAGLCLLCWEFGRQCGVEPQVKSEPYLPSLIEIQERIGAEPDGIYGPETRQKWDQAYIAQSGTAILEGWR